MKRVLSITTALLLLGSTAAMAQGYRGSYNNYRDYGYHDRGGNVAGAAIGAGILGFALGGAVLPMNRAGWVESGRMGGEIFTQGFSTKRFHPPWCSVYTPGAPVRS